MKILSTLIALIALVRPAAGQTADDYRGGWRTDSGEPHTFEFSIRDNNVRGIYCTWCGDATTLAFVDGTYGTNGLTFEVTHVNTDGSATYKDRATARFENGVLKVAGTSGSPSGGQFSYTLIKDPRGPDPLGVVVTAIPKSRTTPPIQRGAGPGVGGGGGGGRGYIQPGPWKSKLAARDVLGVWLGFGAGAPKQYFIFKQVGTSIRGMVCGTCDNTYTMAALDDFVLDGDLLKFNILHEDWGDGELPTFLKHVACRVGWNELRCVTTADHQPTRPVPPGVVPGFSLEGPIAIDATAGNRWSEWPPKGTSR